MSTPEIPLVTFSNGSKAQKLAFGTWQIPQDICSDAVYNAIKVGHRHLDFAEIYRNHKQCGEGIQRALDEGIIKNRSELWITSKIWNDAHLVVEKAVDTILNDLGPSVGGYLDLCLIHWPISFIPGLPPPNYNTELDLATVYQDLEKCVTAGKVKNLGVSNFSIEEVQNILDKCTIKPIVNQVESSIYWKQTELETFLNQNNIVLTAYSPLCQNTPPASCQIEFKNLLQDPTLIEIAKKHNTTVIAVALRYHLDIPQQRICIVKSNHIERIIENYNAVSSLQLDQEDLDAIAKITISFRSLNPVGWRGQDLVFFPNY